MSSAVYQLAWGIRTRVLLHMFVWTDGFKMRMCCCFPSAYFGKYNHQRGHLNCNAWVCCEQFHPVSSVRSCCLPLMPLKEESLQLEIVDFGRISSQLVEWYSHEWMWLFFAKTNEIAENVDPRRFHSHFKLSAFNGSECKT